MLHFRKILGIIFCISLLGSSCTNEEEQSENIDSVAELNFFDKGYIIDASQEEQIAYKHFHLATLAEKLVENNINLEKLFDEKASKGVDSEMRHFNDIFVKNPTSKGNDDVEFSVDAFLGLTEEDFEPFIRVIKDGDYNNAYFLIDTQNPESGDEIVVGLKFDETGKLVIVDDNVTEDEVFGNNSSKQIANAVLEIGIIDDCDGTGIQKSSCGGGSGGTGGGSNNLPDFRIASFRINDLKESWVGGKAEIRIKGYDVASPNSSDCDTRNITSSVSCDDRKGRTIVDLPRDAEGALISSTSPIELNFQPSNSRDLAFIVFEYDGWPAGRKEAKPFGSGNFDIRYRSSNSVYGVFGRNQSDITTGFNYTVGNPATTGMFMTVRLN